MGPTLSFYAPARERAVREHRHKRASVAKYSCDVGQRFCRAAGERLHVAAITCATKGSSGPIGFERDPCVLVSKQRDVATVPRSLTPRVTHPPAFSDVTRKAPAIDRAVRPQRTPASVCTSASSSKRSVAGAGRLAAARMTAGCAGPAGPHRNRASDRECGEV